MTARWFTWALGLASFGCGSSAEKPAHVAASGNLRCRGGGADASESPEIPSTFEWSSSGPLVSPIADYVHPILSVKDPSVVFFDDRWHVFATTANTDGQWSMVHLSFSDFSRAADAPQIYLNDHPNLVGYHAAPQIFFFAPHNLWYLIFQSQQPQYSTTDDITRPETWTRPVNFFASEPAIVTANKGTGTWLDFWVICDEASCYLFFTDDNGQLYRSQTDIARFPEGFGEPEIALQGTKETLFEGSSTYRVDGTDRFLTLVEAFGPSGTRYYRSFVAETLDGEWLPLADAFENPFAASSNVTFESGTAWTSEISHGELIRSGHDQNLAVSLDDLCFLYQGIDPAQTGVEYYQRPYRLGLLSQTK